MLTAQRRALILESLASGGRTVVQLAGELLVSESTIRRDLDALALDGKLERKYGGAILTSGSRATITDSGREEGSLAQ
ncbi:MAG: DeoR family transcriptional regulator [Propioniciclava sp.]